MIHDKPNAVCAKCGKELSTIERAFPGFCRTSDSADAASDGLPRLTPLRLEDGERVMEVSRSLSLLAPPPILDHLGNHPHESDGSDHETEQDFEDERHG